MTTKKSSSINVKCLLFVVLSVAAVLTVVASVTHVRAFRSGNITVIAIPGGEPGYVHIMAADSGMSPLPNIEILIGDDSGSATKARTNSLGSAKVRFSGDGIASFDVNGSEIYRERIWRKGLNSGMKFLVIVE